MEWTEGSYYYNVCHQLEKMQSWGLWLRWRKCWLEWLAPILSIFRVTRLWRNGNKAWRGRTGADQLQCLSCLSVSLGMSLWMLCVREGKTRNRMLPGAGVREEGGGLRYLGQVQLQTKACHCEHTGYSQILEVHVLSENFLLIEISGQVTRENRKKACCGFLISW